MFSVDLFIFHRQTDHVSRHTADGAYVFVARQSYLCGRDWTAYVGPSPVQEGLHARVPSKQFLYQSYAILSWEKIPRRGTEEGCFKEMSWRSEVQPGP